ncbi:MAG: SprB repeat-containing protein, partial [Bacteroidota bacterium]
VTDASGNTSLCVSTVTVVDAVGVTIAPVVLAVPTSCFGGSDGSASVSVSGGTGPYSYVWSTEETSASVTGLTTGSYTVTVTDVHGCTGVAPGVVTQPPMVTVQLSKVDAVCTANGSITAVGGGGTGAKEYSLNGGVYQSTGVFTALASGSYTVTVRDANGCTNSGMITLANLSGMGASLVSSVDASCAGGSDGSATVVGTGGLAPYSYAWSNSQTGSTATGLSAGSYTATAQVTITEPATAVSVTTTQTNPDCAGGTAGEITATGAGGTGSIEYSLNGGAFQNSGLFNNLVSGTYLVTARDANGCTGTTTVILSDPTGPVVSVSNITAASCSGGTNGAVIVTGTGGTSPYSYVWSNGQTTSNAFGLSAGYYTVTMTDANNCKSSAYVLITEPTAIQTAMSAVAISCAGGSDGVASV